MNEIYFDVKYSKIPQFNSIPSLKYGDTIVTDQTLIHQSIAKFVSRYLIIEKKIVKNRF